MHAAGDEGGLALEVGAERVELLAEQLFRGGDGLGRSRGDALGGVQGARLEGVGGHDLADES